MARALKYIIQFSAVGTIYFFLVRFSLELASVYPAATAIWPPAGFALAAVLLGGYRLVPAIFAAAYVAKEHFVRSELCCGRDCGRQCIRSLRGCLSGQLVGGRARRVPDADRHRQIRIDRDNCRGHWRKRRLELDLGLGTSVRIEQVDWEKFASIWLPWWLSDLAALLMITPALVLWVTDRPRSFDLRLLLESAVIFAAAGALRALAFSPLAGHVPNAAPLAVLAVLPPIWAALRRGPRDTATAALILLGFAVWGIAFWRRSVGRRRPRESATLILIVHDRYCDAQPGLGGRRSAPQAHGANSPRHPQGVGPSARAVRPIAKDGSRWSAHRWGGA